jgi:TRAP transporter TAXI family solute receptor
MRIPSNGWCTLVLSMIWLTGCSQTQPQDGSARTGSKKFLSIGTAPPGGAFFVVGGAIGEVLNEYRGPNNWDVTAEATKGSQENIRRLATGELDLGLANSAITYFAVRGEEGWEKAYKMRTVMTLASNVALFLAPADSGVREISDFKGRRIVVGVAGAGFEYFVGPLLKAHGVTYDDFTPLHNTQLGAVDMLSDGAAAAAFLGGAVPTASITQASTSRDVLFIPYSEEAKTQLVRTFPFFRRATIPAGTYPGQNEHFDGLDVGSMHLITSSAADAELVYQLTRTIYENRDGVTERHAAGRAITPGNVIRDTGTPFHTGAIRYYEEIGIWPAGNDNAEAVKSSENP